MRSIRRSRASRQRRGFHISRLSSERDLIAPFWVCYATSSTSSVSLQAARREMSFRPISESPTADLTFERSSILHDLERLLRLFSHLAESFPYEELLCGLLLVSRWHVFSSPHQAKWGLSTLSHLADFYNLSNLRVFSCCYWDEFGFVGRACLGGSSSFNQF